MTKEEKRTHVSKYREIYNTKEGDKFQQHIQHFLDYDGEEDECTAEVLDYMYQALGGTIDNEDEEGQ